MNAMLCAYCSLPYATSDLQRSPYVVACGDSFCNICIISFVGKRIICPVCRKEIDIFTLDTYTMNQALYNMASSVVNGNDIHEVLLQNYITALDKCLKGTESCLRNVNVVSNHFRTFKVAIDSDPAMLALRSKFVVNRKNFQRLEANLYEMDPAKFIDIRLYSRDDDSLWAKLRDSLSTGEKIYAAMIDEGEVHYGKVTEMDGSIYTHPLTLTEREDDSYYFWLEDLVIHLRKKISVGFDVAQNV